MDWRLKKMISNSDANTRHFKRALTHKTRVFQARAIPYGSYTETFAASALVLIGLAVLAATTVSILVTLAII
jgi:hypothetical protein